MALADRLQIGFAVILLTGILVGLFVRGRARSCWSFVAYLLAVAISDLLVALWPDVFWRKSVWMFKENVHSALKLAIVIELTIRIFQPFPAAYVAARRALIAVGIGFGALLAIALGEGTDYRAVVGRLYPHVLDGTVWLFIALAAYCLWYHLPLESIHKAILMALVPYLLIYSVVLRAIVALGWERGDVFNTSGPLAYLVVIFYWLYAAWAKNPNADSAKRVADLVKRRHRAVPAE
jgi:hypothetical protein